MDRQAARIIGEMKRRRIFVSFIMTMTGERISWWDSGRGKVHEGSMDEAALYLRAMERNDRLEVERIGRRLGRAG